MKRTLISLLLCLSLALCFAACDGGKQPEQTTPEVTTEAPTTEEITTEEPTTEEVTTEETPSQEETTKQEVSIDHPSAEEIKAYATTVLETEDILQAALDPGTDSSDFGGLTVNEDGSLTALFSYGQDSVWDPYFYLINQDTPVDNIMVIQYRSEYGQGLNLYMGTEGNVATGNGDNVDGGINATHGDWAYVIMDLTELAYCYDAQAAYLGYLRFGLANTATDGDTVDIGFVAFFHTMDQVNEIIPY